MADLRIEALTKGFGDTIAVDVPLLEIRGGEFFTVVGPSGCGKSTLLNLIAGLEQPTTGSIHAGGRRLDGLPPRARDVAFVFQSYALYPHRTAFENIAFPLELAGVGRDEIRRRVRETAELLGLSAVLDRRPRQLSGGERQRVALGRAIVRQPQLFLFDEPLSNLDAPLRAQTRRELRRLHARLGATFIYVTHDQDEALSLSDRVAVMRGGRIEQCAPPDEIYRRPTTAFVASFFGSPPMNLLPGEVVVDAAGAWAALGDRLRVRLAAPIRRATSRVLVGIRPEHVRIGADPIAGAWSARVEVVEPHGGQQVVEIDLEGVRLTAVERAGASRAAGAAVSVAFDEDLLIFDAETGARAG